MNIQEIFDNAYVVTDGRRIEQFRSLSKAVGLPDAHEWKACVVKDEGWLGNSVSQYSLVRHALESKLPFLLVFEDDAAPCDNAVEEILKAFESRKEDTLCLHLGWNYDSDPEAGENVKDHRRVYGSHAYVLFGEKAYKAYMEEWEKNGIADIVIQNMTGAKMNGKNVFAQYTPDGEALHLPVGWTTDRVIEQAVDIEAQDRFSKAQKVLEDLAAAKTIHVAYTVDIQGAGAVQFRNQLLASLCSLKATGDKICAHVMFSHLDSQLVSDLYKLQGDQFDIECRHIADSDMANFQRFTRNDPSAPVRAWGGIVYARLWLPRFLPYLDKVLYLDSDTLVRRSVKPLWNTDLNGKLLGMNFGIVPEYGYNSGVILMDLKAMREREGLYDRLVAFMSENSLSYKLPDQTTINRFFKDDIADIGREWNFPPTPGVRDPACAKAAIWHFYNSQKPYKIAVDDAGATLMEWNMLAARFGL